MSFRPHIRAIDHLQQAYALLCKEVIRAKQIERLLHTAIKLHEALDGIPTRMNGFRSSEGKEMRQ